MGLTTYPAVHDEHTTIAKLAEGYSLSRHGDGEVALDLRALQSDFTDMARTAHEDVVELEVRRDVGVGHGGWDF